jgi:hypothetical protein
MVAAWCRYQNSICHCWVVIIDSWVVSHNSTLGHDSGSPRITCVPFLYKSCHSAHRFGTKNDLVCDSLLQFFGGQYWRILWDIWCQPNLCGFDYSRCHCCVAWPIRYQHSLDILLCWFESQSRVWPLVVARYWRYKYKKYSSLSYSTARVMFYKLVICSRTFRVMLLVDLLQDSVYSRPRKPYAYTLSLKTHFLHLHLFV